MISATYGVCGLLVLAAILAVIGGYVAGYYCGVKETVKEFFGLEDNDD